MNGIALSNQVFGMTPLESLSNRIFSLFPQAQLVTVKQLSTLELVVNPTPQERTFQYHIRMAHVLGQGCCYMASGQPFDPSLIGQPVTAALNTDLATRVATLDGLFAGLSVNGKSETVLSGKLARRSRQRAEFIAECLKNRYNLRHGSTVIQIGVVAELLRAYQQRGWSCAAYDLEDALVGRELFGTIVQHGSSLPLQPAADVAVVTGMTLGNDTLAVLSNRFHSAGTPLSLFAETGAHLAPHLVGSHVDSAFSEPFPFYVFSEGALIRYFDTSPPMTDFDPSEIL